MLTPRIITKAQKVNAGDYFTAIFCLKHTEHAYLCVLKWFRSHSFSGDCDTHRWSYVVLEISLKVLKWKTNNTSSVCEHGRVAPILLSYRAIAMSVCWCNRVQIFFNDRCATVVFLKTWFSRSLLLVLVLYSSLSYQ